VSFEKKKTIKARLTKNNKSQHLLTDIGSNIERHYDFWTITIFTNPKLALKIIILRIFLSKVLGPSVARQICFLDKT
jgi:hypothetical protein